jgi:hypothetical protein
MRPLALASVVVLVVSTMPLACEGDERPCYPGDFVDCACDSGEPGYAQCDPEGNGYGECGYCGTTPGLAQGAGGSGDGGAGPGGAGGEGGALLPFLAECEENAQCESGLCYPFAAKGPHCTTPCEDASECPPPSTGCNMMGVCKVP